MREVRAVSVGLSLQMVYMLRLRVDARNRNAAEERLQILVRKTKCTTWECPHLEIVRRKRTSKVNIAVE